MVEFLLQQFALTPLDCYQVPGPVNLNRFSAIYDLAQRSDLKYPPFTPGLPARLVGATDLFAAIRQRDVLLHHPYRSFGAGDGPAAPGGDRSGRCWRSSRRCIAPAITRRSSIRWWPRPWPDKDVTVIIELRARFDEEANIELSTGCRKPART
jgi:polyphosphate kinase